MIAVSSRDAVNGETNLSHTRLGVGESCSTNRDVQHDLLHNDLASPSAGARGQNVEKQPHAK